MSTYIVYGDILPHQIRAALEAAVRGNQVCVYVRSDLRAATRMKQIRGCLDNYGLSDYECRQRYISFPRTGGLLYMAVRDSEIRGVRPDFLYFDEYQRERS